MFCVEHQRNIQTSMDLYIKVLLKFTLFLYIYNYNCIQAVCDPDSRMSRHVICLMYLCDLQSYFESKNKNRGTTMLPWEPSGHLEMSYRFLFEVY